MNIMTKRGQLDNIVTYEHFCDDVADLANIPQEQITLGSIAVALKDGSTEGLIVYIADSNKQWIPLIVGGSGGSTPTPISDIAHICTQDEYDSTTGIPTVVLPMENTFYFVPAVDGETNNLFKEWIYVNGNWELFGSVDAPAGALQSDWEQTNSTSLDFIKNKPFGEISSMSAPLSYDKPFGNQSATNYETGTEYNVAVSGVNYFGTYWANAVPNFGEIDSLIARLTVNDTVYYPITLTKQVEEDSDYGDRGIYYEYQVNQGSGASHASSASFNDLPIAIYVFVSDEGNTIEHGDVIFIKDMQAENITSCTLEIGNVTIKKIDKKFLPDEALQQPQSDWNENDSTSTAYIKNRPCYKEEVQQILCEDKIINTTGMSTDNYYSTTSPVSLMGVTMSIVDVFEITYNGINYYPSPVVLDNNNIIVGANPGTDNSYPFGILWQKVSNDYYAAIRVFANQYGENTFSIKTRNVIIQHLDKRYLPTQIFDPMTGDLTIEGTSLTLGNTTITETQLQNLLSLSDATGVGF